MSADGNQMTKEQAEAFGIGSALGRLELKLTYVGDDVGEVKGDVKGIIGRISELERNDARQDQILASLTSVPESDSPNREEFNLLRAEVASGRLTWGKLLAGIGALGGVILAGGALLLNWMTQMGFFAR